MFKKKIFFQATALPCYVLRCFSSSVAARVGTGTPSPLKKACVPDSMMAASRSSFKPRNQAGTHPRCAFTERRCVEALVVYEPDSSINI